VTNKAKLTTSLPSGESNGLPSIADQLVNDPFSTHIVIAVIDAPTSLTDHDAGTVTANVRFRRIEPIKGDHERIAMMLRRALEERTGRAVLPFDLEEEISDVFAGLDPDTGEIRPTDG
jgi:hypothetical protein